MFALVLFMWISFAPPRKAATQGDDQAPAHSIALTIVITGAWKGRRVLHSDGTAGGEKCITRTTGPTQWPCREEEEREGGGGREKGEEESEESGTWQGRMAGSRSK